MGFQVTEENGDLVTILDESTGKKTQLDTSKMDAMQQATIKAIPRKNADPVVLPTQNPILTKMNKLTAASGMPPVGPQLPPAPPDTSADEAITASVDRGATQMMAAPVPQQPTIPPATNNLAGAAAALAGQEKKVVQAAEKQQKKMDEVFAAQEEAIQIGQVIGAQQAEEEAAFRKRAAEIQARDAAVSREDEMVRQQAIKAERDKYEMLANQLAQQKIKPWSPDTGTKIGSMIAAGLRAWGAGLAGQNMDVGMQYLNSLVENDLQKQRSELELKRERVGVQGNILAMTRSMFDDERSAEAAARGLKWQGIEQELQTLLAKQKSGTMQVKATEALAEVQKQKAGALASIDQNTNQMVTGILTTRANIAAQQDQLSIARQQAAMKGAPRGERLSENTIKNYKELEAELKQLQSLKARFYKDTGPSDVVGMSKVPYTSGRAYQSARAFAESRLINRLTGAGVGIEEARRLAGLLPSAGTLDSDASEQWASLENELLLTMQGLREGYQRSGYDVSGLSQVGSVSSFQKPE